MVLCLFEWERCTDESRSTSQGKCREGISDIWNKVPQTLLVSYSTSIHSNYILRTCKCVFLQSLAASPEGSQATYGDV